MSKLDKALYELNTIEQACGLSSPIHTLDPRAKLLVTLGYLISILSLPLSDLSSLILSGVYPVITCAMGGISYSTVFRRSLLVLPFVLFIGIFNPIFDRRIAFYIGNIGISTGWISFFSITLRGILSVQAVLVLILTTGFYNLCRGMQRLGIPALFTTQLLFVYRYIFVLLQESLNMQRAIAARSFGRKSYTLRLWGIFIGQLLIRTVNRSERIHRAMLARGFNGTVKDCLRSVWKKKDSLYLVVWLILFIALRAFHPGLFFNLFFHQ